MAAIRLLKDLEAQGRSATPEEQEVLSRYVGWGGIPQAFDNHLPYDVVVERLHIEEPERPSTPAAQNFHITDPDLGAGGQKTKYQNNVAAAQPRRNRRSYPAM